MIGKIVGAYVGDKLAKQTRGSVDGATGAVLGVLATTVLRRLSLPAMIVLGVGGYAAKKLFDKESAKSPGTLSKPHTLSTTTKPVGVSSSI